MADFAPGFRITRRDKIVLAAGALATVALAAFSSLAAYVAAAAVGHFFLFCNVFRIPRVPELVWAATFVASVLLHVEGRLSFPAAFAASEAAALAGILWSIKLPSYHGIFWQRWNPRLREWWDARR